MSLRISRFNDSLFKIDRKYSISFLFLQKRKTDLLNYYQLIYQIRQIAAII